jgi:hypothetical protein
MKDKINKHKITIKNRKQPSLSKDKIMVLFDVGFNCKIKFKALIA